MVIKSETAPNYSDAQVAIIRGWTGSGTDGRLNFADCKAIAADARMNDANGSQRTAKMIAAKISRERIPYEGAAKTRKDGTKVETKDKLVSQIAERVGVTFEALDKAARADLVKLRDHLVAREAA